MVGPMAQSFTSYIVANDKAFAEKLKEASQVSQDLRIPFGLIASDFYKSNQAIFKLQSAGKYPDLAEKTKEQKLKKFGKIYPILVRTGRLANSLLGPANTGSVSNIGPLSLILGTSVEYGVYHQSDKARKKIPLRKYLFIGPESQGNATDSNAGGKGRLQRWTAILNDHIAAKLRKLSK